MTQNDDNNSKLSSAAYDKVLSRLSRDLEDSATASWDLLQEKIRDAVELEMAAEDMTREELDLLSAYLKRDLKRLGYFAHETGEGLAAWLNFDLNVLEQTLLEQLQRIADQTRIGQEELRERLDHSEDQYLAGELATAGTLACLNCGSTLVLTKTEKLSQCERCGERYFERTFSRDIGT